VSFQSREEGVAQGDANVDAIPNVIPNPLCPFPYFPDALIFSLRFSQFWSVSFCGPAFGVGHEANIFASVARFVCRILPVFLFFHFAPCRSKSSLISPADPCAEGLGHEARAASWFR